METSITGQILGLATRRGRVARGDDRQVLQGVAEIENRLVAVVSFRSQCAQEDAVQFDRDVGHLAGRRDGFVEGFADDPDRFPGVGRLADEQFVEGRTELVGVGSVVDRPVNNNGSGVPSIMYAELNIDAVAWIT